ncbi:glycoside hydrolase family 16 protein [Micromonospora sp. M12]
MHIDRRRLLGSREQSPCSARSRSSPAPRVPPPPNAATCSTTSPTARRATAPDRARLDAAQLRRRPRRARSDLVPEQHHLPTVSGQKVMQLTASTDGTGAGTNQAELYSTQKRYLEGTYASRVRFTDTPVSGNDGDHINQTFFTISPLSGDLDPTYSELDISEYLPNGGWGETGPINYQTTWYTYRNEPWYADNLHSEQRSSLNGWHDLVATVANGHVIYYIDGVQVGDHSGKFYPRQTMTINWNLWFIDTAAHSGGLSTYIQQVDWCCSRKTRRSPRPGFVENGGVPLGGQHVRRHGRFHGHLLEPDEPTDHAANDPPTTPPPAGNCSTAPEWAFGTASPAARP